MDPTSYRIPIRFDQSSTATDTHLHSRQGRKRKQSSSLCEYEYEAQRAQPLDKKARRASWTDDSKTALLQCRLHLNRIFENDDETVVKCAWEKIADMLDMTCTGDDCVQMFDFLVKKYLTKQQINFEGVSSKSPEWRQYQTLEKLFLSSPRLAEAYESVELSSADEDQEFRSSSVSEDESDDESAEIMKMLLLEVSKYNACFTKFYHHIRDRRRMQRLQENKLVKIVKDLLRIREENMLVVSEFLKRILFRFNELDELAKRESLEALTAVFPGLFSVSSVAISAVSHYLKSSAFENERLESNSVFLMAFSRLLSNLVDIPDGEDAFYVKFIPFHDQYFDPVATSSPESITSQSSLSNFNFKGHLHVSRSTVEELIKQIGFIKSKKPNPLRISISIERQMILFMWYLTHNETNEQLALRFSVFLTEILVIIRHFIVLLNEDLNLMSWPHRDSTKKEIISAFESMGTDSFPGVIGALGTTYLSIKTPAWFSNDQGNVGENQKIRQHIAVQAIADSKCVFISVHVAWLEISDTKPGHLKPVHTEETKKVTRYKAEDVFWKSPFYVAFCRRPKGSAKVATFFLPENIHVVADSTYPLMESVMVPYNKTLEESPSQYLFDEQLHKSRSAVEVAFGKLINRFTRLRCMDHSLLHSEGLIKACIGIHNFCMKSGDDFGAERIKLPEKAIDRIAKADKAAVAKRDKICEELCSGEISYIYRNSGPHESNIEFDSASNIGDASDNYSE